MAYERPDRDNHAGLAIVAALQSDPSGRTVHTGSNPLVPLLNGSFDLLRAARAADVAFKQWDAAYATDVAAAVEAVAPTPAPVVLTAHERREAVLASLKLVDDEIIEAAILEAEKLKDAAPPAAAPDATPPAASTGEGDATGLV